MAEVTLDPYIFFQGNCREAMEFYKGVFGGELTFQTMGEAPAEMQSMGKKDDIMHAALRTEGFALFGSDGSKASAEAKKVDLSLGGSDEAEMQKIFDALSEGGKVVMSLGKQFWGDIFGMLVDRYGVEWMVNVTLAKG